MPCAIAAHGVSKNYGATAALRDVSLDVMGGTIHGLVGGNGSGKSTLIKILAGVVPADGPGTLRVREREVETRRITPAWSAAAGLRFVHQDIGVFPEMTVAENLALGRGFELGRSGRIRWQDVNARAEGLLERFGIDARPEQPLSELSSAARMLVAIARALQDQDHNEGGALVLDEPTACLPAPEVDALLDSLSGYAAAGHAIVLVSHRLGEIVRVADAVTVLRDGAVAATLEREEINEDRLIELIAGRPLDQDPGVPGRRVAPVPGSPEVLSVRGLRCGPLHDVSFDLRPGEIVGVAGLLGSGRSRLLRSLFGVDESESRTMMLDGRPVVFNKVAEAIAAGVAYVPEDRARDGAFLDMTIRENTTSGRLAPYWRGLRLRHDEEARDVREAIVRHHVVAASDQQPLGTLSGGNQQKVVIARWLRTSPRLLLLDEPTQGVDVSARLEIHSLVRQAVDQGCAALVVSSDFEELEAIADRVLILRGGTITDELTRPGMTAAAITHRAFKATEVAA